MSGYRPSPFKLGLAGSVAALALAPVLGAAPALAQVTPNPTATLAPVPAYNTAPAAPTAPAENVVVTGSRLKTSNATAEAPITVITAKQIEQSSSQTIEDVLHKIPSIGTDGVQNTTNNGSNGASCLDLRNLGITRTLFLVDGRRFVHTGFGNGSDCVDLDTIPLNLVDRIEILKDGASTIYGADAVAGVINIIMKKNFVGTTINASGNITASGDGTTGDISGLTGFDFANGRGNVALSGRYEDVGPVLQKDRDWATPVVTADNGLGNAYTLGSGYTTNGRIYGDDYSGQTIVNNRVTRFSSSYLGANGGNPTANGRYDYGHDSYLSKRLTDGQLDGSAHFDVNDHLTLYATSYYTHKNTQTQLSGQPITGNPNTGQSFDIPQGNPYAEALGIDELVQETRRITDWGVRDYNTSTDSWQATGGARGNITGNWDYDAYFTYGKSVTNIGYTGQVQWSHLEQSVGAQNVPGGNVDDVVYNPGICTGNCAPLNPFGANNASASAIKYDTFTAHSSAIYQFRDVGATITNNKLLRLPYGPLGLAIGMEHRGENGAYHPDPIINAGDSTASIENPTGGGFNVTEVFGELNIPLLKNLIAVKDLSADISGRWSDYSTFGSVQNWKAGLNWSPTRDIRFRANIGTSVRQPAISEAFGGQTLSFNQATDPCDATQNYGALNGNVTANCAKQGINHASYTEQSAQVATLIGGNPNLQPESSRTYTIGTVITPRWVPHLTAAVDYWHTKIANSIGTLTTQYILDQCYTSVNFSSPYCASAGQRTATTQINNAQALYSNLGEIHTNGIDFDLNYYVNLGGGHRISLDNELTDLIGFTEQLTPNGNFINLKGRVTALNTGLYPAGYPVLRDNATVTYSKGGFSFAWTVRYIDGMLYNDGSNDADPSVDRFSKTNQVFYHDIVATYNWKKAQLVAGIDNLFDRTPPFVLDTSVNTASQVYDVLGRTFYAKLQFHF
ncbi:TonB-dependent receptor domain-containing protein [Rhizosaccharibacter radicis]|uniref:TonB-dependent receptor n=1 Tax=Rhizosaccharibacter radicis TaxID=2782605 RepID=A0ABT1W3C2_9PROT|nr:TonB-dependent receptor [Acetobacteraceae bacterium KSS12]